MRPARMCVPEDVIAGPRAKLVAELAHVQQFVPRQPPKEAVHRQIWRKLGEAHEARVLLPAPHARRARATARPRTDATATI